MISNYELRPIKKLTHWFEKYFDIQNVNWRLWIEHKTNFLVQKEIFVYNINCESTLSNTILMQTKTRNVKRSYGNMTFSYLETIAAINLLVWSFDIVGCLIFKDFGANLSSGLFLLSHCSLPFHNLKVV